MEDSAVVDVEGMAAAGDAAADEAAVAENTAADDAGGCCWVLLVVVVVVERRFLFFRRLGLELFGTALGLLLPSSDVCVFFYAGGGTCGARTCTRCTSHVKYICPSCESERGN